MHRVMLKDVWVGFFVTQGRFCCSISIVRCLCVRQVEFSGVFVFLLLPAVRGTSDHDSSHLPPKVAAQTFCAQAAFFKMVFGNLVINFLAKILRISINYGTASAKFKKKPFRKKKFFKKVK